MSRMGRATSRFRLMLCESCASGEDWGDIHIDTEVLNEIAPLAQDRRARKSHHLPIMAGIDWLCLYNLANPPLPQFLKIVSAFPYNSPANIQSPDQLLNAAHPLCLSATKEH